MFLRHMRTDLAYLQHMCMELTSLPQLHILLPTQLLLLLKVREKKKQWGKISPQALNPAALMLHRHTSDSSFYLCTLPLPTTALIAVPAFSWSFLTTLPPPFPCPVLIAAYKSSKLFHAREIPD